MNKKRKPDSSSLHCKPILDAYDESINLISALHDVEESIKILIEDGLQVPVSALELRAYLRRAVFAEQRLLELQNYANAG